jgi:RNA polymerase sigma factor (sigma-70 family)
VSGSASKQHIGASASEVTGPEAVYERVAPVVQRMVWLYAGADPERDDIAQDALLSVLKNTGSVTDAEQLEAWAARVTFNTICSAFRRRKLRRWLPLEALQSDELPARESDFEGREILARVQRLLERLPAAERLPLALELLGNASQQEIARRCGCSQRTVRRRLKTARQRFMRLARADPGLRSRVRAT